MIKEIFWNQSGNSEGPMLCAIKILNNRNKRSATTRTPEDPYPLEKITLKTLNIYNYFK